MRCDLHVHTLHSGPTDIPFFGSICRESYSPPDQLYERLKRRGMDLVTVTDHDSIEAAEELRRKPDFFLSEEVSCETPGGARLHVGVYNINERQHLEMQRRRRDLPAFLAYLNEQELFYTLNHPLSRLTGTRNAADFEWFEREFCAFEVLNGHMPAASNRRARRMAREMTKWGVGGSDAHTLHSAASAYTEIAAASNKEEFLQGLRQGRARARGQSGSYWKLTLDVMTIAACMMRENYFTVLLAPLMLAVPAATLASFWLEIQFGRHWMRRVSRSGGKSAGGWRASNLHKAPEAAV
jgi:predicted metal-dependent phosphoesterase TrpH